jgi:galactose mutarotase-like enzyme
MPIDEHLFDEDALVIEGGQAHEVSLAGPDKVPYLTVRFDAPLFGLWSPAKKHAPFVCIEPWYGRCDRETFGGGLADREYGHELRPGRSFEVSYTIECR